MSHSKGRYNYFDKKILLRFFSKLHDDVQKAELYKGKTKNCPPSNLEWVEMSNNIENFDFGDRSENVSKSIDQHVLHVKRT